MKLTGGGVPLTRMRIVFLVLFSIFALVVVFAHLSPAKKISVADLASCFNLPPEEAFACKKNIIGALLERISAQEMMRQAEDTFPPGQCHSIGHVVGQHISAKTFESAMFVCGGRCNFACIHGAIGEAFKTSPRIEEMHARGVLDTTLIQDEGKMLCTEGQSCHGLGHTLFQIMSSLSGALGMCDAVSANESHTWSCYSGVFMENGMINSSSAVSSSGEKKEYRDPEDLLFPCNSIERVYRGACYHFLHLTQDRTLDEKKITSGLERTRFRVQACATISEEAERAMCFEGVGMSLFVPEPVSIAEAHIRCANAEDSVSVAACSAGFSHALTIFEHAQEAVDFCSHALRENKQACYEGIFWPSITWSLYSLDEICAMTADSECMTFRDLYKGHRPFFLK